MRARGHPVVTAFQDLCLGAPLSDVLLLLPLECVVGDSTKKQGDNSECPLTPSALR